VRVISRTGELMVMMQMKVAADLLMDSNRYH
jgi:hypothetical protein